MPQPQMTIRQALELGLQHQQSLRFAEAEHLYRQVLAAKPDQPDALHLLGLVAAHYKRFDAAADLIRRAIAIRPGIWGYHNHLGLVLLDSGKFDVAEQELRRAIELNPSAADAHANLARALEVQGRLNDAVESLRQASKFDPGSAEIWCNLGSALQTIGSTSESITASQRAIALSPQTPAPHNNLAVALTAQGQLEEAANAARRAIQLAPDFAHAHNTLGNTLWLLNDLPAAAATCREAVRLMPTLAGAYSNLAAILLNQCKEEEAIWACRKAIELQPDLSQAYNTLAHVSKYQGRGDEAVEYLRQAVALNPTYPHLHSNLVFAACFLSEVNGNETLAEAKAWAERFAPPDNFEPASEENQRAGSRAEESGSSEYLRDRLSIDKIPGRKLKVGYVSPDFRRHPVARFLWPLIAHHDRGKFEVHCFSDTLNIDPTTIEFRSSADRWHNIVGLDDQAAADLIRAEKIDILVDLAGHTARNRLLVFARRPAPVQVSWLGYPATTGLAMMDYRLTDAYADPPGMTELHHTEKLIRLPKTAWCYQSQFDFNIERKTEATITFGSYNNFAKVNDPLLKLWAVILHRVPGSRLILKSAPLLSRSLQDLTRKVFESQGISPDRIDLRGWHDSPADHVAAYNQIDIALDTFPYHGTTTTCEALWMGVPVVTLAGQCHLSRVGVSLLSNVGLPKLIARSREEYVKIAARLANDRLRLQDLRNTLRDRMKASDLMNAVEFARAVEAAYREMVFA